MTERLQDRAGLQVADFHRRIGVGGNGHLLFARMKSKAEWQRPLAERMKQLSAVQGIYLNGSVILGQGNRPAVGAEIEGAALAVFHFENDFAFREVPDAKPEGLLSVERAQKALVRTELQRGCNRCAFTGQMKQFGIIGNPADANLPALIAASVPPIIVVECEHVRARRARIPLANNMNIRQ